MARCFIGLSGYSYKPWQGVDRFYPPELKAKEFLGYYCTKYCAVEMDGTWYRNPSVEAVAAWNEGTPDALKFSFKLHRRITHVARLKPECFDEVAFICKRLAPLASVEKLGSFLIQLPPNLKKSADRLSAFIAILPETFDGIEGYTGPKGQPARWAVEFRNETWNCDEIEEILRSRNIAWVASDTDDVKAVRRDTADFHHVRLRRTVFTDEQLNDWGAYFENSRSNGQDSYIYCKHEDDGAPWIWADYLIDRIKA